MAGIIVIAFAMTVTNCGRSEAQSVDDSFIDTVSASVKNEDTLSAFKDMSSLLDGWTYENKFGEDDWRVDIWLDAHGAHPAKLGDVPDVRLDQTNKDGEVVLWVRYHGQERFVSGNSPNWGVEIRKLILDMARVRIVELREQIDRQLAAK